MQRSIKNRLAQLELGFQRDKEPDRNHQKGGRSFYFFDLDDNVFHLSTCIYLFHKDTKEELEVSTGEFARIHSRVGVKGPLEKYCLDFDPQTGSFRRFRDWSPQRLKQLTQKEQPFIEDLISALTRPDFTWKGPSWEFFYHAVYNYRPIALITARGHAPETLKRGIEFLEELGHLDGLPNYVGVYPVSHPETQNLLAPGVKNPSVAFLKKQAIIRSVKQAMQIYGENPYHRFGMSDDDPKNIELIIEAMQELKRLYPKNSFFVIDSTTHPIEKQEVFCDHIEQLPVESTIQLDLFENSPAAL